MDAGNQLNKASVPTKETAAKFPNLERLMFVLSGEHPTIPMAEVCGAIEAERQDFEIMDYLDQILVVKTKADPGILANRLAMCHQICWHLSTSSLDDALDAIGSSDIVDLIPHGKTFSVRVKRIKKYSPQVDTQKLAKQIADLVAREIEFKVDLVNPDIEIICALSEDQCVAGMLATKVDRTQLFKRRPTSRVAFHPSTLTPPLARCMVNLARTPRGGVLLDPFCGMGGILIEAGLIGAKPVGIDVDPKMIDGSRKNLEEAGVADFELIPGDAQRLPDMEVDAIATDPPYGRQATTHGVPLEKLYEKALAEMEKVLKKKSYLCITSPSTVEIENIATDAGLKLVERHEQRVHKGLTRLIYVFRGE